MLELPKKNLVFPNVPLPAVVLDGATYLSPDEFYGPSEFPLVLVLPAFYFAKIIVISEEVTVTCRDDFPAGDSEIIGDPVTVEEGLYTYPTYPSDTEGITNLELKTLSELPQDILNLMVGKTPEELQEVPYNLLENTATLLSVYLVQQQLALNITARNMALGMLTCYWENKRIERACPPNTTGYMNETSVVEAGVIRSFISQLDADTQAETLALSKLLCLFGNHSVEVTCQDKYPEPPPIPDPDPENPTPPYPYRFVKGDPVVVLANTFTATTQAQADAMALAYAESELECYWENSIINVDCDIAVLSTYTLQELGDRTTHVRTDTQLSEQPRGLLVEVAAGVFTSVVDQDDADAAAQAVASSLLDCKWESKEMEIYGCDWYREDGVKLERRFCDETDPTCLMLKKIPECDVPDMACVPTWENSASCYVYGEADPPPDACALISTVPSAQYVPQADCVPSLWYPDKGKLYKVVRAENDDRAFLLKRGYSISYQSQTDADALALTKQKASILCSYCNLKIPGTCQPAGLLPGFDQETGLYPDGSSVIPSFSEWALNATVGLPAKLICGPDYLAVLAQSTALSLHSYGTTKDETISCIYGNDEIYVSCVEGHTPDGVKIYGAYSQEGIPLNPDGTTAGPSLGVGVAYDLDWTFAYPQQGEHITVPENTFTATQKTAGGKSPKVFANLLAISYGLSITNCPKRTV